MTRDRKAASDLYSARFHEKYNDAFCQEQIDHTKKQIEELPKQTSYREILRELFGKKENAGQAERGDLRDTTEATKPGMVIKRERDSRLLER